VRPIEDRTLNPWVRIALRGVLNPARSFANLMDLKVPWYRESRAGVYSYVPDPAAVRAAPEACAARPDLSSTPARAAWVESHTRSLGGVAYNNGFQMTTGIVLRLGTW
jgi:hypothetical protein